PEPTVAGVTVTAVPTATATATNTATATATSTPVPPTATPSPVVPEPPPLWLFGSGLLALGRLRWWGERPRRQAGTRSPPGGARVWRPAQGIRVPCRNARTGAEAQPTGRDRRPISILEAGTGRAYAFYV